MGTSNVYGAALLSTALAFVAIIVALIVVVSAGSLLELLALVLSPISFFVVYYVAVGLKGLSEATDHLGYVDVGLSAAAALTTAGDLGIDGKTHHRAV